MAVLRDRGVTLVVVPGLAQREPGIHSFHQHCGPMDSGFVLRTPRNHDGGPNGEGSDALASNPSLLPQQDAFSSREPENHFARKRFRVSAGL
ncbi:protein of unknown function [Bradyrhizobium vignae]|uniref:Uncharacterized protein n=1 Tax=Bradyrhizobium vignae TaxID=1549949 RepID=A0A2U3PX67_9BRAD|nr:protein of unknown function [Bradyrhizobium vignae]